MEVTGHRVNTAKIGHLIIGCLLFRGCPFTHGDSGVQAIFAGPTNGDGIQKGSGYIDH